MKKDQPWVDARGRPEGTEYYDSLGHHRKVAAPATEAEDGTVTHGHEAIAVFAAHCDEVQGRRRAASRRMSTTPHRDPAAWCWAPEGRGSSARRSSEPAGTAAPTATLPSLPRAGFARFAGRTSRPTGRRRRPTAPTSTPTVTGSAASVRATAPAASCRPRRQPADFRRDDGLDADGRTAAELVVCRCNGHHLELEPGECSKCGHWLPEAHPKGRVQLYAAFARSLAEPTAVDRLVERYRKAAA